jgi:RHH-type proline utilization regulon transcriptional repressor/proline dehydrogenase/delta 1-pyrroline-5-carboxylate dehydrogenase
MSELLPRVRALCAAGAPYDIGINIDAEEADRLEISLDLLERSASSRSWPAGTASVSWCRAIRSAARS